MGLMDTLQEAEQEMVPEEKPHDLYLVPRQAILKAAFLNIDLYSDTLVYTWLDKNRVKFSLDGLNNKFLVKKNTKFHNRGAWLPDHFLTEEELEKGMKSEIMEHIENQFKEELNDFFHVNGFVITHNKIIFYIKDK